MTHAEWTEDEEARLRRIIKEADENAWDRKLSSKVRTATQGHRDAGSRQLGSFRSAAEPRLKGPRFLLAACGGIVLALSALWLIISPGIEIGKQEADAPVVETTAVTPPATERTSGVEDPQAPATVQTPPHRQAQTAPIVITPEGARQAIVITGTQDGLLQVQPQGLDQDKDSTHVLWQVGLDGQVRFLTELGNEPLTLTGASAEAGARFFVTMENANSRHDLPKGPVTMTGTVPTH